MKQTILLTGATGKFGRVFLKELSEKGYQIIFTSRNREKIKEIENNLQNVIGIEIDFMEANPAEKIVDFLSEKKLEPNVLVNNARNSEYNRIEANGMIKEEIFLNEYKMEVYIPYLLSMKLSLAFDSLKNIINIASMYGVVPPNPELYDDFEHQSPINYGVTKAALIHLTKELAVRLSQKEIRVNAISYGGVKGRVDEAFKQRYAKLCPMGRMLKEEEITGSLEYLISEASAPMTGHNLVVDGGWSVW